MTIEQRYFKVANVCFAIEGDTELFNNLSSFEPFGLDDSSCVLFFIKTTNRKISYSNKKVHLATFDAAAGKVEIFSDNDHNFTRLQTHDSLFVMKSTTCFTLNTIYLSEITHSSSVVSFFTMLLYTFKSVERGSFILHSSVIVLNEKAYSFFGDSGVGKSTLSKNWQKAFPDSFLLNDDNPIITIDGDNAVVSGSPWSGKVDCYKNKTYPIQAFFSLKKSKSSNKLFHLSKYDAIREILPSCCRSPFGKDRIHSLIGLVIKCCTKSNIYIYHSLNKPDAARYLYDSLKLKFVDHAYFSNLVNHYISRGKEVVFTVKGNSMSPLIKHEKNRVILTKVDLSNLENGIIVLARINNNVVLHRIVAITGNDIVLKGDGNDYCENCKKSDLIATVRYIIKINS